MNKTEIFNLIGASPIPSKIDFFIEDELMSIKLSKSCVLSNMQEDGSAFEGWILCILSKLPGGLVNQIKISWEPIEESEKNGHYYRFIYRLLKFQKKFTNFNCELSNEIEINNFIIDYDKSLVINYPKSASKDVDKESEAYIERRFKNSKKIYRDLKFDFINHQLPVGIFKNAVSKENALFTGGKSAIDLWGTINDELWIFELKFKNAKVGVITELLFYMWIMEDVFIDKWIKYPQLSPKELSKSVRDFDKLYEKEISKIIGVLLVDRFHPLVTEKVISLINENLNENLIVKTQLFDIQSDIKFL